MKGWSALLNQTAHQLMDELERLEPNSMVLALAKAVFQNAEAAGTRPSGRPTNSRADARRAKLAQRQVEDKEIAASYLGGHSMLQIASALGRSQGYISTSLSRQGIPIRRKGPRLGFQIDQDRVDRIRQGRAQGMTLAELGAQEHISRERVRQICSRFGIETKADHELSPAQLAAVNEYEAGESLGLVASRHNVGIHALRSWVIRAGYVPRPAGPRPTKETRRRASRAARLYRDKVPAADIAKALGLKSEEQIYRLLARAGVKPDRKPTSGRRGLRS